MSGVVLRVFYLECEVMIVVIKNPRVTATATLQLEDQTEVSVTVERDASQASVLDSIQTAVRAEAERLASIGKQMTIPSDEDLVEALRVFTKLMATPLTVS